MQLPICCSPRCRAGAYVPRASTGQTNPNSFCSLCACFLSDYYPPCSIPTLCSRLLSCARLFLTTHDMPCFLFYAMLQVELGFSHLVLLRLTSFRGCPSFPHCHWTCPYGAKNSISELVGLKQALGFRALSRKGEDRLHV